MKTDHQIQFFVAGVPKTAGSKRGIPIYRGKKGQKVFTGKTVVVDTAKNQDWKLAIRQAFLNTREGYPPIRTGAIWIDVLFFFSRPKSHFGTGKNANVLKASAPKHHLQDPDTAKLYRCLEDALTGILFKDDNQVIDVSAGKAWGERPGADVRIRWE